MAMAATRRPTSRLRPRPESKEIKAKGGALPGPIVGPLRHRGARLGSVPWCIQRSHDNASRQRSQTPRSRGMQRTGESYTAARAHIVRKPRTSARTTLAAGAAAAPTSAPAPATYASLAGTSDATLKRATGCSWERWVRSLDHHGAKQHIPPRHRHAGENEIQGRRWWSQTVAVGYERIRGLRARGQQRDGTFEATKSRTFNVPIPRLFAAWADAATRRRSMDGANVRYAPRLDPSRCASTRDSDGIVAVGFFAKGSAKKLSRALARQAPGPRIGHEAQAVLVGSPRCPRRSAPSRRMSVLPNSLDSP